MRFPFRRKPVMQLIPIRKTGGSLVENCPALYRVGAGGRFGDGYVVQGVKLTRRERRKLKNLGPDESAVWVQSDVIEGPGKRV